MVAEDLTRLLLAALISSVAIECRLRRRGRRAARHGSRQRRQSAPDRARHHRQHIAGNPGAGPSSPTRRRVPRRALPPSRGTACVSSSRDVDGHDPRRRGDRRQGHRDPRDAAAGQGNDRACENGRDGRRGQLTESTSTQTTISSEFIDALPILGRNYQDVLTLAPGCHGRGRRQQPEHPRRAHATR